MSCIIKQYNKKANTIYCYESVSYRVPGLKTPRSRRKLIGKIDPATGEMIPTGKRGRPRKNKGASETENPAVEGTPCPDPGKTDAHKAALLDAVKRNQELEARICEQAKDIEQLRSQLIKITDSVERLSRSIAQCLQDCKESLQGFMH